MTLASSLAHFVDWRRRDSGRQYYQRGQVAVTDCGPEMVEAIVSGSEAYVVRLTRDADDLRAFCSCPFFEKGEICKHVWAVILQADELKGLRRSRGDLPRRLTTSATVARERGRPRQRSRPSHPYRQSRQSRQYPPGAIPWASSPRARPRPAARPAGGWAGDPLPAGRARHAEKPAAHGPGHDRPAGRRRVGGGRSAAPDRDDLPRLPEPRPHDPLPARPGGAGHRPGGGIRAMARLSRFRRSARSRRRRRGPGLPDRLHGPVLGAPRQGHQGRPAPPLGRRPALGGLAGGARGGGGGLPARRRRCAAATSGWRPPPPPVVLGDSGFLLAGDRLASLADGGSGWSVLLESGKALRVPAAERDELLGRLLAAPDLPPLDLPASMRFEEARPVPRPRLRLLPPRWVRGSPRAELSFLYEGLEVTAGSSRRGLYQPAERRLPAPRSGGRGGRAPSACASSDSGTDPDSFPPAAGAADLHRPGCRRPSPRSSPRAGRWRRRGSSTAPPARSR